MPLDIKLSVQVSVQKLRTFEKKLIEDWLVSHDVVYKLTL